MDSGGGIVIIRPRKRRLEEEEDDYDFENVEEKQGLVVNFGAPEETADLRRHLYQNCLSTVMLAINTLEEEWGQSTVAQVSKFITNATQLFTNKELVTPVAFVPSGLSSEENTKVFDKIVEQVRIETSMVCRINSTRCPNVKIAFQTICKQLLQKTQNVSVVQDSIFVHDESSEFEETMTQDKKRDTDSKFRYLSIHDLQKCYETRFPKYFAIVIENADFFAPNVLAQLLQLLSSSKLPFVFFIGVNHCVNNYNRFIPANCSTPFVFSTFQTISTTECLNHAFCEILNDDVVPILLGSSIVQYLSSYFQSQHTSLKRLLQAYQLCILEHCRKPESVLCGGLEPKKLEKFFEEMKIEGKSCSALKEKVLACKKKIINWSFLFNFILFTQKSLNGTSRTKLMKDLYISCASGTFFHTPDGSLECPFDSFLNEIKRLNSVGLKNLILRVCEDLGLCGSKKNAFITKKSHVYVTNSNVADFVSELDHICDLAENLEKNEKAESGENSKPKTNIKLRKKMDRRELQEMMKQSISSQSASNALLELRKTFVSFITSNVKIHLKPLKDTLGLYYNAFVFDDVNTLKCFFSPDPQMCVTNSLLLPSKFLECKCCSGLDCHSVDPSLPDTSILFKLLKEQMNKKIDLNILFQSFMAIIEEDCEQQQGTGRPRRKSTKIQKVDIDVCLVRFRQAVAELQFVGVLKRSRTNPDEITKLVWL